MATKQHKDLYSQHEEYDPLLNKKLQLLYQGGFAILKQADLFLERLGGLETMKAYQTRLKSVAYIPYLSEFITQFSASLFSESLEVNAQGDASDTSTAGEDMTDDFYKEFLECCDLERRSFHQFAQDTLEKGLSELCVYVSLDFPKGERLNRAQEKAQGLDRGYICTIPYENVIDWKIDPATGKFIWVKEFEECLTNDSPTEEVKHYFQFKLRTLKPGKKGKMMGGWEVWKSEIMPLSKKPTANTKYTLDPDEVITSFPEINLWKFCINRAYHVGQQIGSICQEHYQRRSFMVANANKTCVSIGVVTLGPEIGAPGDVTPQDIDVPATPSHLRSQLENEGWTVLRSGEQWSDKIEIVEAKGESHKFIADELERLVEAMMQTLRQMNMTASANTKSVGRSAASKSIDQHGTSMLLSVYERIVKDFTKLLFTCLAAGREEDIRWAIEGLSIAEPTVDRQQTVSEMQSFGVDILKFPDMWKNKYLNRVATELIDNNLTDKERLELSDKFQELIETGKFEALDPEEAMAAGNKMAQNMGSPDASLPSATDNPSKDMPITDQGHPQLPDGAHLQTGKHIDAMTVYNHLAKDYNPQDIDFVKQLPWSGPSDVPLSSIDSSDMDNWAAAQPDQADKVQGWADKFANDEDVKPIVVVNNPSNDNKMQIIDGHHRHLGALKAGKPIPAYIGQVGSDHGPWDRLHAKQNGIASSLSSMQKELSNQVKVSEK